MPIQFFVVDTKKEVITSNAACTQLGLTNALGINGTSQYRHLDTIRKHTQPENTSTATTIPPCEEYNMTSHPFQDHTVTVPPSQDHKAIHSKDLQGFGDTQIIPDPEDLSKTM